MKVDDIYEIDNHFHACTYVIDNLLEPLHTAHLRKLHSLLFYGTEADRNGTMRTGEFRANLHKYGLPPDQISKELSTLIKEYEAKKKVQLQDILEFHVRFERIHPFEDGNGRLGRLLIFKECLRHEITPFILDDKRRTEYLKGIREWDMDKSTLFTTCLEAQARFQAQIDLQELQEYAQRYKPADYKED
jgi:Fic family protein